MDRRALLGFAPLVLAAAAAPAHARSEEAAPTSSYVPLRPLTATVIRADGRRGVMTVEVGVDAPDAALRARAAQSLPRLRAAFNVVVQRTALSLLPAAPPNADRLAAELQAAANTVLGRAGGRVLLGTVMVV